MLLFISQWVDLNRALDLSGKYVPMEKMTQKYTHETKTTKTKVLWSTSLMSVTGNDPSKHLHPHIDTLLSTEQKP